MVLVVVEGAGTTVIVIAGLVAPTWDAVISVVPAATPVTRPFEFTVAMPVLELVQIATAEMSLVEPSV